MAKRNIFNRVPVRRIKRSSFDLSHKVLTTMDMMKLYPVGSPIQCIPGDKIKLGHQCVGQANPMSSPTFSDISIYFMDFFVSYRNIYPDMDEHLFERFIANETLDNGDTPVLPRMNETDHPELSELDYSLYNSLWDYFGFQTGVKPSGLSAPLDAPFRAYKQIWNEYFRDEKLQEELDISDMSDTISPLSVNYGRDYFTSAFINPQQGEAVTLPLSGYAPLRGDPTVYLDGYNEEIDITSDTLKYGMYTPRVGSSSTSSNPNTNLLIQSNGYSTNVGDTFILNKHLKIRTQDVEAFGVHPDNSSLLDYPKGSLYVDMSSVAGADINDLRLSNALQRWKEINNNCGTRYTEFLRAQYGVAPRDERLQRPEYIGGTKAPLIVSQVLQTSNSDAQESPTGFKYGQGMIASSDYAGIYHVKEFGMIITLAFIRPKILYEDGIPREWTPETYLDFMNPLYTGLGEQAIKNSEVFVVDGDGNEALNRGIWGYQSMYQEYRYRPDRVTGKMRSNITGSQSNSFDYWHTGRHFESLPELNSNFIKGDDSNLNRLFQAGNTEVQFLCEIGNIVKAVRPLPYYAVPHL